MSKTLDHFTQPELPGASLGDLEQTLACNPFEFFESCKQPALGSLAEFEQEFRHFCVPESGESVAEHTKRVLSRLVTHASRTSSPKFIGHMTSALPQFLLPQAKIMVALNQNVVKIETSDILTPLEREVTAMMHHLSYQFDDSFYQQHSQSDSGALGVFCSGGTVANITALWNARNLMFPENGDFAGVSQTGLAEALIHHGYKGAAILVSQRGHYSLAKSADLLGLGRQNIIAVETDENNKINTEVLESTIQELESRSIKVMAIVGIAGSTETGSIDPLYDMAEIASRNDIYFHVDAAWGGATLMSNQHRILLNGIELADSITIDAHKQMYVPMGAGMVLFRDPATANGIQHHANYILRKGSGDLGRHTLEGSRPAMAMLVHSCLSILGRQGYEEIIDGSLALAKTFAQMIELDEDFELISEPELCLLTYRFVPARIQEMLRNSHGAKQNIINAKLNMLTVEIQEQQRDAGITFVSRTQLQPHCYDGQTVIVFRVVLANPLTTAEILAEVLDEQRRLAGKLLYKLDELDENNTPGNAKSNNVATLSMRRPSIKQVIVAEDSSASFDRKAG